MALALDGTPVHNNATSGTSLAASAFTTTVATEVYVAVTVNGATVSSITGGSLTFARRTSAANGGDPVELWAAPAASALSGVSFTVNLSGSTTFITVDVFAFKGNDTSTVFDTNGAIPASASSSPVAVTTSNASDGIINAFRMSSGASPTVGNIAGVAATQIHTGDFQEVQWRSVATTLSAQDCTIGSGTSNGALADALMAVVSTAALTGTATSSITEADVVAGGKTVILTLTGDTYVSDTPTITYVGGQKGSFAGSTSNQTITFSLTGGTDSAPLAGDLVIISFAVGSAARNPTLAIQNSGGTAYTLIGSQLLSDDSFDTILRSAYRFMPGTPETTAILAGGSGNAQDAGTWTVHVFRNVDTSTPLDGVAVTTATGVDGHAANPPSITPSTAGAVTYHAGAAAMGTGAVFTSGDLTAFQTATQADTNDSSIGAGYLTWSGSGANDPAAFGGGGAGTTTDSWAALSCVLRPGPSAFSAARSAMASGLDSAQAEAAGWDAKVKPNIPVANIVRTSSTVCTITLQAQADYNITAQETITATIPASILSGGVQIVASPTFTVDTSGAASFNAGRATGATKTIGGVF